MIRVFFIHVSMEADVLKTIQTSLAQAGFVQTSLESADCEAGIAILTTASSTDDSFLFECLRVLARGLPLYILRMERVKIPDLLKSAVVIDAMRDLDWALKNLVEQRGASRGLPEYRGGGSRGDTPEVGADPVHFRAYYPTEVMATKRASLHVYAAFKDELTLVAQDHSMFESPHIATDVTTARQAVALAPGAEITVIPECADVTFSPVTLTKTWDDEWMRFDFDFKPRADLVGEALFVRVSIMAYGVEIAHLKLSMQVISPEHVTSENPLASARLQQSAGKIYQRIFVSYSRKDTAVVEIYRLIQLALGNEVFVDTYSIRTGEDWRTALAAAIDSADVFQLFWSPNSAESENVRHEWDYALHYKCKDIDSAGYIRPVVWTKPFPPVPTELSHLNFRYVPLLDYLPS